MLDGNCVLQEDCGCITDEGASVPNGYVHVDCAKRCSCSDNEYECKNHSEDECILGIGCPCERE